MISFLTFTLLLCCGINVLSFSQRHIHHLSIPKGSEKTTSSINVGMIESLDVIGSLDTLFKNQPYEAALITCASKAASSDFIAQRQVEKKKLETFEWKRSVSFMTYGGLYQGVAQYYIFNEIFPIVFGNGVDIITVAYKVLFDQLVLTPFLCLPMVYLVKAVAFGQTLRDGMERYVSDVKKDLLWKYWLIWTPTQCLTFSVVPEHLRIVFIAAVSFIWLIILSTISSRDNSIEEV